MKIGSRCCESRRGTPICVVERMNSAPNRPLLCLGFACLAAIVLTVAAEAWGDQNQMRFGRLTLEDGLSNGSILAMLQDKRGFLWFGTEAGLNRYDGHTFVQYRHDPEVPGSLPHDYVLGLAEDGSGDIWIGTDGGGLGRWDHLTDSFVSMTKESTAPDGLASNAVRAVTFDEKGLLWIGTRDGGLQSFNPLSGLWQSFRHDPEDPTSLGNDSVYAIWIDDDGTMWIGTDGGLGRLDPDRVAGCCCCYLHSEPLGGDTGVAFRRELDVSKVRVVENPGGSRNLLFGGASQLIIDRNVVAMDANLHRVSFGGRVSAPEVAVVVWSVGPV